LFLVAIRHEDQDRLSSCVGAELIAGVEQIHDREG
jgi:hypothetical protein